MLRYQYRDESARAEFEGGEWTPFGRQVEESPAEVQEAPPQVQATEKHGKENPSKKRKPKEKQPTNKVKPAKRAKKSEGKHIYMYTESVIAVVHVLYFMFLSNIHNWSNHSRGTV